jgi:hypothetical protein
VGIEESARSIQSFRCQGKIIEEIAQLEAQKDQEAQTAQDYQNDTVAAENDLIQMRQRVEEEKARLNVVLSES